MTSQQARDVGHQAGLSPLHHVSQAWHIPVIPYLGGGGRRAEVQGHFQLHKEFQVSLVYKKRKLHFLPVYLCFLNFL